MQRSITGQQKVIRIRTNVSPFRMKFNSVALLVYLEPPKETKAPQFEVSGGRAKGNSG